MKLADKARRLPDQRQPLGRKPVGCSDEELDLVLGWLDGDYTPGQAARARGGSQTSWYAWAGRILMSAYRARKLVRRGK